jgi:putative DNA primase/helicase
MTGETLERARGRWREILPMLGKIDTRFLTNKHGPCPLCGGRDRYRFDDRNGEGSYFCGQCGAGSGVILLRKARGWTFKEACDEIDRFLGEIGHRPVLPAAEPPRPGNGSALARIERALAEAHSPGVVDAYLQRRGLSITSSVLRGDAGAPYFNDDRKLIGRYPAVVAPITGPDGSLRSAQRIYDADLNSRKKTLPPVGTINGAAVHLFPVTDELAVTEGIENALAFHQMHGLPVWAAISDTGIATFEPPPHIRPLVIAGDTDASFAGQAASFALAKRLRSEMQARKRSEFEIEVRLPQTPGVDWLDMLNAGGQP